ncbi:MAG: hypothetical protein K9M97_13885, partial [Akkermansiaceae bacterium]|nr:hypothetical protein [Akkermansiaceae bacterium]
TYVAEVESMEDTPHGLEFIAVAPATGQASYEVYGSTVRQVVDAVNGHPQANDMVSALALYETPGNWDVANGVAATSLAGGVNPSPEAASVGQLLRFSTATITTDPPVWYFSVGSGSATEWKPLATQDGEETLSNKTLAAPVISGYTESSLASGTVGAAATLSLDGGTYLTATLTASTACTFTMPPVAIGKSFILLLKQAAATGNGTATFTGVIWNQDGAPVITATAGKMDILTFTSDGVDWFGSCSQGFTPSIP